MRFFQKKITSFIEADAVSLRKPHIRSMDIITVKRRLSLTTWAVEVKICSVSQKKNNYRSTVRSPPGSRVTRLWRRYLKCGQSEVWEYLLKLTHDTGGEKPTPDFYLMSLGEEPDN
jgi:hypothetical protein